jgi:signal transduction histidine kinase
MGYRELQNAAWHRIRQVLVPANWRLPVVATVAIAFGLTITLFFAMRYWERREKQAQFDYASGHFVEAIRRATERMQLAHEFVRQDYHGSTSVSREEFGLCCEPIFARVPSLKVLQWAPAVSQAERAAFEQKAHRDGWPNYRIVEPDAQGRLIPAKPREEHFPIWYAATKSGFQARWGWDFAADPVLVKTIDSCRDTGQFAVSDMIDLSNIGLYPRVLQTFMPVYRDYRNTNTVAERRKRFAGLLVGLVRVDDLIDRALSYATGPQGMDIALFDDSITNGGRLLYFHQSRLRDEHDSTLASRVEKHPGGIHNTAALTFGGRRWSLVCTPAPQFFGDNATWRSWTTLIIGLVVSCLSGAYVWSATTRTERIQRLVDQRTAELRKKDEQLQQSQKLEAVGALAGGIAHEFNNLLQAISGFTRYAMEALKPEDQPYQDLQNVLQAADRAATLTRQLLSFSRRQAVERTRLDTNQTIGSLMKMLRPLLGEQIQLKVILGTDIEPIFADAGSLQQVLLNLCLNARDAMPSGGEIVVKTENMSVSQEFAELYADMKSGRYVEVSVTDTGSGMSAELRARIFEPFFTTKPVGKGTGLGLSMVYGIVQQHEGTIHVYSEEGRGTTFRVLLPVFQSEEIAVKDKQSAPAIGGTETILMAEDDPMVRDIGRRVLEKGGYTVLAASDGEEALSLFRARHADIALVLLDAVMPRLGGQDVYRRIKDEYPGTKVVFCSGYDPDTAHSNFIVNEHLRLVEKPYDPLTLLRTVREVLDAEVLCPTA